MTKLAQTISRRVHILTGEDIPLGCMSVNYPRATGRTTAISLKAISDAMVFGSAFVTDHDDYPQYCTELGAKLLVGRIRGLIDSMGLVGFSVILTHNGIRRPNGSYVYGARVQWSPVQEVFYDLRK